MKNTGKALVWGAIMAFAFSSCGLFGGGRKGPCPAYGKTDTFKTQSHQSVR